MYSYWEELQQPVYDPAAGRFVVGPGRGCLQVSTPAGLWWVQEGAVCGCLHRLFPASPISRYLVLSFLATRLSLNNTQHTDPCQKPSKSHQTSEAQTASVTFSKKYIHHITDGVIILSIMILTSDFRLSCIWFLQDLLRLWNVKPRTGKTTTFRRYSSANKPKVQEFSFLDMLWARSGLWLWDPTWDVMWFKPTNKYSGSRKPLYANANTEQSFKTFHRQFL